MSEFYKQQLTLNSTQPVHKYKLCGKCNEMRAPEGGVEMSPTKWVCVACWISRKTRKNLRNMKKD
jgi:formylmethanofuran dehydrogenase subunit E